MSTRCAIAGVGITPFGKNPEATVRTLAESAVKQAMRDAGIEAQQVDQVYFANAVAGLITGQEMIR